MSKYLAPLVVFGGGFLLMLFTFIFFPTLKIAGDDLATNSAAYADTFWNWDLISGNFLIFLVLMFEFLLTMWATFKAFLAVR